MRMLSGSSRFGQADMSDGGDGFGYDDDDDDHDHDDYDYDYDDVDILAEIITSLQIDTDDNDDAQGWYIV
jgi:hypothetical protein